MSPWSAPPPRRALPRWNPWRALRASEVELRFADFAEGRGLWERTGAGDVIWLEAALDRRTRREVLAHELVHAERGIGSPAASPRTMQAEEERVWRITLERLAPRAEVLAFLEQRGSVGPVTLADLAEEFDLSEEAAARVAHLLAVDGRGPP